MTPARDVFRIAGSPPQEGCEDVAAECVPVYYRGKVGRVDGLVGTVDVACDATTRYVLEAASRGMGLGSRVAYGCGRVEVTTLAR